MDDAESHGDDMTAATRRADAGAALLAERFGGATPPARAAEGLDRDVIRAEAMNEAERLWTRMRTL
jgi:hypothetical protein